MKKVLSGKVYDTEKATFQGEWDNGYTYGDFHFCEENLYKKRTGEFFLHGSGGPLSKYARCCGNNRYGDEKIIPMTFEEAKKWAEEKLDGDDYEKIFGELSEEDEEKTILSLSISKIASEKARKAASEKGLSLSAYIESLII